MSQDLVDLIATFIMKKDKCYGFQPNDIKCNCFERDENKLIMESLIENSEICTIPKLDNEIWG